MCVSFFTILTEFEYIVTHRPLLPQAPGVMAGLAILVWNGLSRLCNKQGYGTIINNTYSVLHQRAKVAKLPTIHTKTKLHL